MPKILIVARPEKCSGCELCVLEAQRQTEKVGLEESLIRVFTDKEQDKEYPKFYPDIDPRINSINIEKIKEICPRMVLEIEEQKNN